MCVLSLLTVLGEDYEYDYDEGAVHGNEGSPAFFDSPRDYVVNTGDAVTFPCRAEKCKIE